MPPFPLQSICYTETLSCLADCTGRFLKRIENHLVLEKSGAIALLNAEMKLADLNKNDQEIVEENARKKKLKGIFNILGFKAKPLMLMLEFKELLLIYGKT